MKCKCSGGKCGKPLCGYALFSTTVAKDEFWEGGRQVDFQASKRLLEVLDSGHEVHIVSSRPASGFGEGRIGDKCLLDLIPRDRFWTTPERVGYELIEEKRDRLSQPMRAVLKHLGVDISLHSPSDGSWSHTDLQDLAEELGAKVK